MLGCPRRWRELPNQSSVQPLPSLSPHHVENHRIAEGAEQPAAELGRAESGEVRPTNRVPPGVRTSNKKVPPKGKVEGLAHPGHPSDAPSCLARPTYFLPGPAPGTSRGPGA